MPRSPSGPATPSRAPDQARFERHEALERLAGEHFDVLVIGGGITGAGVALDAASRGLRTALVERGDFASGTSSKSSKMVHGGLRYLQQRELGLVYESLAERQRLLENAPHLVSPLPFVIPLFGRQGVVSRAVVRSYATALWLYDLTGGWRIGTRHRRMSRDEVLGHFPSLDTGRLVAGFLYFDARADDARLTLALVRTAVLDHGAVAANYSSVEALRTSGSRVTGARLRPDPAAGPASETIDVACSVVVNATGVWADEVRALDEGTHPRSLRPAKGVHVTVPGDRLQCDVAVVVPVRGDRRSVFVVPWPEAGLVYIGTTDTSYDGSLDDPVCTPDDVDYLLGAVNAVTTARLERKDVTGVWAGLRPLVAPGANGRRVPERTADLSRRHAVSTSPHGMVTVTGGKLTTYRKMAEDTVDRAVRLLGPDLHPGRCRTRKLPLIGGGRPAPALEPTTGVDAAIVAHLRSRYGGETAQVLAVAEGRPDLLEPVVAGLPYLKAEVVHGARSEMARTLDDVLARRTRALLQDAVGCAEAAPTVARLLAGELGWGAEEAERRATAFAARVLAELEAAGVHPRGPAAPGVRQ